MANGNGRVTGVVKRIIRDKKFGFIKADAGGTEYFFHGSTVRGGVEGFEALSEGDRVSFAIDEQRQDKGPRARDVDEVR